MRERFVAASVAVVAVVGFARLVVGDVHTAEYKGSALCKVCHKLTHEEMVVAYEKTAHPRALQKPDAEGAIVADFSTNPAFTKDKVAYVLGKGHHEQAFLDADLEVLPAKWDVASKSWKPLKSVDGATQCIGCHVTNYDPAKKAYTEAGVGCEACHGPGGEHAAGDKEAIVNPGKLDGAKATMVCGQCHSAGKDPAGKFAHPVGFRPGDDLKKTFVDARPNGPGRNQQYSEHLQSKHAAEGTGCTACHESHKLVGTEGQLKQPVNELCLSCHADTVKDMAAHAPDAAADATCASCHMHSGQHTFAKAEK